MINFHQVFVRQTLDNCFNLKWFTTPCVQNSVCLSQSTPNFLLPRIKYVSIGDLLTHFRWNTSMVICIRNKITYFCQLCSLHDSSFQSLTHTHTHSQIKSPRRSDLNFQFSILSWEDTQTEGDSRIRCNFQPLFTKILCRWLLTFPSDNHFQRANLIRKLVYSQSFQLIIECDVMFSGGKSQASIILLA